MSKESESGRVNSVIKALRVLECFTTSTPEMTLTQLSRELGATPVTIRSDLEALEQSGQLVRIQGGAIPAVRPAARQDQGVISRMEEKKAIAQAVAAMKSSTRHYILVSLEEDDLNDTILTEIANGIRADLRVIRFFWNERNFFYMIRTQ